MAASANEPCALEKFARINVRVDHFPKNCDQFTISGRKVPAESQSIFRGVPKSCLNQVTSTEKIKTKSRTLQHFLSI